MIDKPVQTKTLKAFKHLQKCLQQPLSEALEALKSSVVDYGADGDGGDERSAGRKNNYEME